MRRLPVYLLVDCSESMAGEAIGFVDSSLGTLLKELRSDPYALEIAFLSVITFGSSVKQVVPLTELCQFRVPKLVLGSGTALGEALKLLEQSLDKEIIKTTAESKGDYKPLCFLLTDGAPTDTWQKMADRIKSLSGRKATIVAIACGPDARTSVLHRITDNVIVAKDNSPVTFAKFLKWVSASISSASRSIDQGGDGTINLDSLPADCLKKSNPDESEENTGDDNQVFLHCKCAKQKSLYLMRFQKQDGYGQAAYKGIASYKLEEFDFGPKGNKENLKVSCQELVDPPACPYCGDKQWAMCSCGKVHCSPVLLESQTHQLTCPWCGNRGMYTLSTFDVGRGIG